MAEEICSQVEALQYTGENKVINAPVMEDSKIVFHGTGNILYAAGDKTILKGCVINFRADNSLLYLSPSKFKISIICSMFHDSVVFIGRNFYSGGNVRLLAAEQKHVFIGDSCQIAYGCWLRTNDSHLIYSIDGLKRINPPKSIYIGDHVWCGQGVTIFKGARVGSGAVITSNTVLAGRQVPSNRVVSGSPARQEAGKLFYSSVTTNAFRKAKLAKYDTFADSRWVYEHDPQDELSFDELEQAFSAKHQPEEKAEFIDLQIASRPERRNRFFIAAGAHFQI